MSKIVDKARTKAVEEINAISFVVKHVVFSSFFKITAFVLWLIMIVLIPISFVLRDNGIEPAGIYTQLSLWVAQFTFLIILLLYLIFQDKVAKWYIFLPLFVVSGIFNWLFIFELGIFMVVGMTVLIAALIFYFFERTVIVATTAPVITFATEKTGLYSKKINPLFIVVIELIVLYLIKTPIQAFVIPDSMKGPAYFAWIGTDMFLTLGLFLFYLLIAWRKSPFYDDLRKNFIWMVPIVQLYSFYLAARLYWGETADNPTLPGLLDVLILVGLAFWNIVSETKNKIKEQGKEYPKAKQTRFLLFIYTLTLYATLVDEIAGDLEVTIYWAAVFTGLGVIVLVGQVAQKLGIKHNMRQVNLLNLLLNQIRPHIPPAIQVPLQHPPTYTEQQSSSSFCPNCGAQIRDTKRSFCGTCGYNLSERIEKKSDLICSNCHFPYNLPSKFCSNCGEKV